MNNTERHEKGSLIFLGRIVQFLASPWVTPAAILLALLLTFPTVKNGLDADDYYHRAVMTGSPRFSQYLGGPQDMFRFMPGDPDRAQALMDIGFLPWWTCPEAKAEFLQFLTVQTHIFDYWAWPDQPELMHIHSLAWFAVLILLASLFYRRFLGPTWMAGVATLLFAVEDGHGAPVGWICNRNILLAASFGIGCLIVHDIWRRSGRKSALVFAMLLWLCSLCSKEAGIATCAYLAAYAFWLDRAPLVRRLATLVPYGMVLIMWRLVRDQLGYGVENLGLYVDPITDPTRFITALAERYPILLLGQWGFPPSDFSVTLQHLLGSPLWWFAVTCSGAMFLVAWPLLKKDRLARFFATGMLLAAIPILATFPTDRLLMFVGLGAMGLLTRFWHFVFAANTLRLTNIAWRALAVSLAVYFIFQHVIVAPPLLAMRASAPTGPRAIVDRLYVHLPNDANLEHQDVIIVNPPSAMHANYCLLLREHAGEPGPRCVRSLASGFTSMRIHRTNEMALEITPQGGYFRLFLDRLFRNEACPLQLGESVSLRGMEATVQTLTEDGHPAVVEFRFDRPLEDPSLRWIYWKHDEFVPFTVPAVGEEMVLEWEWQPLLDLRS